MPLHRLHPIAVHFPIVLLCVGALAAVLGRRREALAQTASWSLWLGTASAWLALGLGLLAEDSAPHVPSAWKILHSHETLAYWSAGCFTALSLWRWRAARHGESLFLALWLGACALLGYTAHLGGELVFSHGVGVVSGQPMEQ